MVVMPSVAAVSLLRLSCSFSWLLSWLWGRQKHTHWASLINIKAGTGDNIMRTAVNTIFNLLFFFKGNSFSQAKRFQVQPSFMAFCILQMCVILQGRWHMGLCIRGQAFKTFLREGKASVQWCVIIGSTVLKSSCWYTNQIHYLQTIKINKENLRSSPYRGDKAVFMVALWLCDVRKGTFLWTRVHGENLPNFTRNLGTFSCLWILQ